AINCSSVTASAGLAAGSCPEVISVVIWRLSLDRSISRYLYSPPLVADTSLLRLMPGQKVQDRRAVVSVGEVRGGLGERV
ncbi:hypothetical protein, partial [Verrucosispora sp. FIM060022]|uniref:hypothetical protein n=1 Tax=Verrucosispora sp. FIM060022 TaxID=1479020 RepID=UPI00256F4C06